MSPIQFYATLVVLLVFVQLADVSAVGRGLRSQRAENVADQGPSPAELEEQEEEDGTQEQEVPMPQQPQQVFQQEELGLPSEPVQALESSPPSPRFLPAAQEQEPVQAPESSPPNPRFLPAAQDQPPASDPVQTAPEQTAPEDSQVDADSELDAAPEAASETAMFAAKQKRVELSTLSTKESSLPRAARNGINNLHQDLRKAFTTPFPITVPGMSSPIDAKSLFPPLVQPSMKAKPDTTMDSDTFQALMKNQAQGPIPPVDPEEFTTCHPPCIGGRGVCNDNLCFCKTPYTGTTCQHKLGKYARVSYVMLAAASVVLFGFGILSAQIVHAFFTGYYEKRLALYGDGFIRREVWHPPENKKGKAVGHAIPAPPAPAH